MTGPFEISFVRPGSTNRLAAARYYDPRHSQPFSLGCRAIKRVRNNMGLTNVKVMIPFCRTVEEGAWGKQRPWDSEWRGIPRPPVEGSLCHLFMMGRELTRSRRCFLGLLR